VKDSFAIRAAALAQNIPYFTTLAGAKAACLGMKERREITVYPLQELHKRLH
jgi:carbamoyl-phosphate synthase large subunit